MSRVWKQPRLAPDVCFSVSLFFTHKLETRYHQLNWFHFCYWLCFVSVRKKYLPAWIFHTQRSYIRIAAVVSIKIRVTFIRFYSFERKTRQGQINNHAYSVASQASFRNESDVLYFYLFLYYLWRYALSWNPFLLPSMFLEEIQLYSFAFGPAN